MTPQKRVGNNVGFTVKAEGLRTLLVAHFLIILMYGGKCGGIQGGRQMAPLTVDGHQLAIGILRTPELSECSYQLN